MIFKLRNRTKQGIPVAEIAKENGISRPTIYKIKKANDL
nr:helix-turn-helix domain-containing protein [Enterococcus faecium]